VTDSAVDLGPDTALNRVCPYYTMFPLSFPWRLLRRHAQSGDRVLDPFCGRGTTPYAARLLGLDSLGIDISPVATAIAKAKVINTTPAEVLREYDDIVATKLGTMPPQGPYWTCAYDSETLGILAALRQGLAERPPSSPRTALTAVVLGALHGPRTKGVPSYLSNQSQRTFAPKPEYAIKFWTRRRLQPTAVDVRGVLERRAWRYLGREATPARGRIVLGDSRDRRTLSRNGSGYRWIITSPPYYGLRTYLPDQWLRHWFLGGPSEPDYSYGVQVSHRSPEAFATDVRRAWTLAAELATDDAKLVFRFGGINDRVADPLDIARASIVDSGWRWKRHRSAGHAGYGKRQADHFGRALAPARQEFDVWAERVPS
jgi:DNA methylase